MSLVGCPMHMRSTHCVMLKLLKHQTRNLQRDHCQQSFENWVMGDCQVDLTKGSQNPMDSVSFFHHAESTEKVSLRAKQISTMFPLSNLVRILPTI